MPTRPVTWARRALALGAQFVIAGLGGIHTVEADDFFVDLFETAIGDDEILTEVADPEAHRLGRALTRSSCASPISGRSWRSRPPYARRAAPSPRRASA